MDAGHFVSAQQRLQALYLAESGMAWELEKLVHGLEPPEETPASGQSKSFAEIPSLSEEPSFGFSSLIDSGPPWPKLRMGPGLPEPTVSLKRDKAFWEIRSTGFFRQESVTVVARFGEALDELLFGPALTLENDLPFEMPSAEKIEGSVRLKTKAETDDNSSPWNETLQLAGRLNSFAEKAYGTAAEDLRADLNREGGAAGNGFFTEGRPPDFEKNPIQVFTFGDVEIIGGSFEPLVLQGPGRISARGDIRLRGNVVLNDISLSAGRDIVLEDSIFSQNLSLFAERNLLISDRCSLLVQGLAGGSLRVRGSAAFHSRSLLMSVGRLGDAETKPSEAGSAPYTLTMEGLSRPRGFVLAAGGGASIHLGRGVVLSGVLYSAGSARIDGEMHGPVLALSLPCAANEAINCLGQGRIRRFRAPIDLVQPAGLANTPPGQRRFLLLEWRQARNG